MLGITIELRRLCRVCLGLVHSWTAILTVKFWSTRPRLGGGDGLDVSRYRRDRRDRRHCLFLFNWPGRPGTLTTIPKVIVLRFLPCPPKADIDYTEDESQS
jgi:hypothetical protein